MQAYEWILFDADETLFHFDAFAGLKLMLSECGVDFSPADYAEFQSINRPLWVAYQNGEITAQDIKDRRFAVWSLRLGLETSYLNSLFLKAIAEISGPLPGAASLLNGLSGKAKLGIITNGFMDLQDIRLEKAGLSDIFHVLIISEIVGVAKPNPKIFEHALENMGYPARSRVLMVGDNLESDILGANNIGFDTCWLNPQLSPSFDSIEPTFQVASLSELEEMLRPHYFLV